MSEKPLVAHQPMKEFDPECERHFPLLIVKAVEPGCTTEIQIENAQTGNVIRLTTADDPKADEQLFVTVLGRTFLHAFRAYCDKPS